MSKTLMHASREWASRPADERYTSLIDMRDTLAKQKEQSRALILSNRKLEFQPAANDQVKGLEVVNATDQPALATHWSFGQMAGLAGAPAGYLRKLPAPIAADCLNYGLKYARDVEECGVLVTETKSATTLRAATGPNYGRVWNCDIAAMLVERFGDGVTGQWRVPGEFGKAVKVTKANTTLYAGDRDMFVFLADEERRIELPGRRAGRDGSFARGFFVWNSEVGSQTIGAAFFLFDYVCCNRIVWGAEEFREVRIRHTSGAPDRWLENVQPVLEDYSNSSAEPVIVAIEEARKRKIDGDVNEFLQKRFGKALAVEIAHTHEVEEGRPIETVWDAVVGGTAHARSFQNQDRRVEIERAAGKLLAA